MSGMWAHSAIDIFHDGLTCDCPLHYGKKCRDVSPSDCQLWEKHVAERSSALIALGAAEWRKTRKRRIPVAEEQLRKIEEEKVSDLGGMDGP
jgi:hypothetical protein